MKNDLICSGYPAEKIEIIKIAFKLENMPKIESIQKKKQIIFTGRLTAKKAICDAIDAFHLFYRNNPEYTFVIIGEGPEKEDAEKKIWELSLQDTVKLLGLQDPEHTFKHMVESEIFILPSKTAPNGDKEGTPVVIIEAELLGLPIVSTIHAGIPEIAVNNKNALLSKEGDVKGMAESLNILAKKPRILKSFSQFGMKYAENNFEIKKRVTELIELYCEL
jgi:glycosyltransferase involved in cell wall biosynthesis